MKSICFNDAIKQKQTLFGQGHSETILVHDNNCPCIIKI